MKIAAIGCSYTNYIWPTYADLLEADNFGLAGIGNDRIWYILLDLYKTTKIQNYDLVIVQWTSPYRYDYLTANGWTPNDGNIATSELNRDIWRNIRGWYNDVYEKTKSENYVVAAKSLLKQSGVEFYFMSMTKDLLDVELPNLIKHYTGRYKFTSAPWNSAGFTDIHPNIIQQIHIAEKIYATKGCKLNSSVVEKSLELHKKLEAGIDFKHAEHLYKSQFPNRYIATGF